ncbi:hypothetical protein P7C71_g226, partial [Lecanoromycetidae sp. Uapishka_2]
MDPYQYWPLENDSKHVRLMTLLPQKDGADLRIMLDNVHMGLDPRPSYEALSYAWGNAQETVRIRVEDAVTPSFTQDTTNPQAPSQKGGKLRDKSLIVTQNLAVALQHLRYMDEPHVLTEP